MDLGPATQCQPALMGRSEHGPGQGHGRPSALHPSGGQTEDRLSGLRRDNVHPYWVSDTDRVLAFHRWLDGTGQDVVVVATLADTTWWGYQIGFPSGGHWKEVFNSDVYHNWVNPVVAGNGGGIDVSGPPMHDFATSASVVIPANGVVVFAGS
jgi:1,4-alpha-glucan branching enzyme